MSERKNWKALLDSEIERDKIKVNKDIWISNYKVGIPAKKQENYSNEMSILLDKQPIVSKSDSRKYRLIKLTSNDLEVLLVSDPETDKSSAAINVNVG